MGLDVPKLFTGAIGHALKGVVIESVGLKGDCIGIHQSATLSIIGVEQYHVIAIADEEPIRVVSMNDGLIDIIKHDVGYQQ